MADSRRVLVNLAASYSTRNDKNEKRRTTRSQQEEDVLKKNSLMTRLVVSVSLLSMAGLLAGCPEKQKPVVTAPPPAVLTKMRRLPFFSIL